MSAKSAESTFDAKAFLRTLTRLADVGLKPAMLAPYARGLLRLGRDLGLGLVNAAPALRRAFIREAAGLTGDLPRLMTGQAV